MKNNFLKRPILFYVLLGLLIREIFAGWTGHPWDFEVWVRLGKHVAHGYNPYVMLSYDPSISFSPYQEMESIGYPPLAAYIFALSYLAYRFVSTNLNWDNRVIYYFILKQPMIISDTFISLLILKYHERRKTVNSVGVLPYILWIYNPYCILISSIWGALDPISILLTFLAVFLAEKRKYLLSGISLGIAAAVKTLPLIFLIPLLIDTFVKDNLQKRNAILKLLLGFVVIFSSSILTPFTVNNWDWSGFYNSMSYQANLPVYGGISPFLILEYTKEDIPLLLHNALSSLWAVLLVASYVYSWKKKLTLPRCLLLASILFITFRTFISEPLILYPLLFMIVADERCKTTKAKRIYSLMVLSLLNLTINNTLLIRFITPTCIEAFNMDIYLNNTEPTASIRLALREIFALLLFQDFLSAIFDEEPLLPRITRSFSPSNKKSIIGYFMFFSLTLSLGLGLDYTVISMVTDWHRIMEQPFFLDLDMLSAYHLFLALIFLIWILTITLLKKGTKVEKLKTFLALLILVIISAGIALPIFQYMRTGKLITGEPLVLVKGIYIQDRIFFVLALSSLSALPVIVSLETLLNRTICVRSSLHIIRSEKYRRNVRSSSKL